MSVDNHFNECWLQGSESSPQRVVQTFSTVNAGGLAPLPARERTEIDVGQRRTDGSVESEVMSELNQRLVAPIVHNHKRNGQAQLRRGPQTLDRVKTRSVTQQSDHLPARGPQGNANGRRQTMSQSATRAGIERVPLEYGQIIMHG